MVRKKYILYLQLIFLLINFSVAVSAQTVEKDSPLVFDFTGGLVLQTDYGMLVGQLAPKCCYDDLRGKMAYSSLWFDLAIDWGMRNDGMYNAEEKYFGGRYFAMYDTKISLHDPDGFFSISAGRSPHKDAVESPYSVFINSNDIPAMHIDLCYDDGFFFYKTRWVQLNTNSMYQYPASGVSAPFLDSTLNAVWGGYTGEWLDKGANFKTFGIRLSKWRVGFQDVVIYLDRSFDAEYFFNPMPQYFVQIINSSFGRPWSQAGNAKSYMGFFTDRVDSKSYFEAQLLMDDFNANFFPGFEQSPAIKTKMAWSVGGWKDFDIGRVGFYHGGATKYTFEATYTAQQYEMFSDDPGFIEIPYSIFPYEATYVPVTQYETEDGTSMAIDYTANYFSYKYGENNLAFLIDYQNMFFQSTPFSFGLYSSLEWILNGSKSPSNPWHEYYSGTQDSARIALLDGTIEHLVRLRTAIRKPLGKNFVANLDITTGVAINAIKLIEVPPVDSTVVSYEGWEEPKIYVPQEGLIEPVLKLTIGGTWSVPVR